MLRAGLAVLVGWTLAACAGAPTPWPDPAVAGVAPPLDAGAPLTLEVEHPAAGAVLDAARPAFLVGRAEALGGGEDRLDVVFAIDVSRSAEQPTGEDPAIWYPPTDQPRRPVPEHSVLAAEVRAVRWLARSIDVRRHRLGLVTFSGLVLTSRSGAAALDGDPAVTWVPLTHDRARLEAQLDAILARGANGMTHMSAGIDLSTANLVGGPGGRSEPAPSSRKVIVLLTDGTPTLPYLNYERENERAVETAARRAAGYGIRIFSYAIGPEALARPLACVTAADTSGGRFGAVRDPAALPQLLGHINLARVERVEIHNLTSGSAAAAVKLHADGSYEALVPLLAGENRLEVVAFSDTGSTARVQRVLHARHDGRPQAIPPQLAPRHDALVDRVADRERQRRRRELLLELEQEIVRARVRAERQRRELQIEPELPLPR